MHDLVIGLFINRFEFGLKINNKSITRMALTEAVLSGQFSFED